jgi:2-polyprenyl-3-methyl-5-hydroxy-6-metoxy-1,4-benzoquinol methylase
VLIAKKNTVNKSFNDLYRAKVDYYGGGASPSLVRYLQMYNVPNYGPALDLGCGQGRNALYLAQQGFSVLGVDSSDQAIKDLADIAKQKELKITSKVANMEDFNITPNYYNLIVANTSLDHLSHDVGDQIARNMINGLAPGGYIFVSVFMTSDPGMSETANHVKHYYYTGELRTQFSDLTLLSYQEELWMDTEHGDSHYHSMARLFAQREM